MSSLFENFYALIQRKLSALGDGAIPDDLPMLDALSYLDSTPAKTATNKVIAKAHFDLANSRHDLVKFATKGFDLFWASAAKMPHPYGLQPLLGHHPSLISHPNGFSVFLQYTAVEQRLVLSKARDRHPDRYVASLLRLMASGTINSYHAMEVIQQEDLSVFGQPAYKALLQDLVAGKEGLPSSTTRNRRSLASVFWLAGYPELAKDLAGAITPDGRDGMLTFVTSVLNNALMTSSQDFLARSVEMLGDLYGIDEQSQLIDQALKTCVSSTSDASGLLFQFLLDRARQAHELGTLDQIKIWLPDHLSKNNWQVTSIHGSGFLWTVLALNPTWIAGNKTFCESMSDPKYLTGIVSHTDIQSWKDLVSHAATEDGALFSLLAQLDVKAVKALNMEDTVINLFLEGVALGKDERLAGISGEQDKLWKGITDMTEKLAGALGEYCSSHPDEARITQIFDILTHPRYRRALLEPLPRFPALLQQLPSSERDRVMSGDLGL